jgi:lysophospholipase L1-like esterase
MKATRLLRESVRFFISLLCASVSLWFNSAAAADAFALKDGDRVVLIGSTLIEREQRYGYWETALTERYPGVTFRNLGWSGDTVFGTAQASFGSTADGFKHLKEHVAAVKPTVILIGYGTNEAFDGEAGLPKFLDGLNTLLDTLATHKARVVLLSPLRHEDLGRPLPDPAPQNKNVRLYADALRQAAKKRGYGFVDLYDLLGDGTKATPPGPYTDNGMHLTAYGYWRSAAALEQGLGLKPLRWRVTIDGKNVVAEGAKATVTDSAPLRFEVTDAVLPPPPAPKDAPKGAALPGAERVLRVKGLADGRYVLKIDGKPVALASAAEWAAGVPLTRGPEFEQAEKLRAAVLDKNHQYFHRWRPQNETYLFGFRKQEQGQNAREIPQFDPIVEKMEAYIAKLRVPATHKYELAPQAPAEK